MFVCFYLSLVLLMLSEFFFFFQAEDGIRDHCVTGVQTCALPILLGGAAARGGVGGRALPAGRRRAREGARALDPGKGARPPARAPAGGVALARGDLRVGPGLRAAPAAPVRLAAARGARLREHDPRGAEGRGA